MSKLMVVGASGFIGKHLCHNREDFIRVVRRLNHNDNVRSVIITNLDQNVCWQKVLPSDVDCIIHLAGLAHSNNYSKDDYQIVNVEGSLHLAREAFNSGVKRFVFVSSIGVNGSSTHNEPFSVEMAVHPRNSYTQSKYDAEIGLKKIAEETGLELVIVRPTLVYGPNAPGNFGLLTKFVKKLPVLPFGLANNKRDFIAVQNLADLLITCATHPNAGGHTFLASDMETVSIKQFTNAIADGLGKKVLQLPIPVSLMRLVGKLTGKSTMVEQLVGNLQVDSSNIKEVLDWTPPYTMQQAMATLRDLGK